MCDFDRLLRRIGARGLSCCARFVSSRHQAENGTGKSGVEEGIALLAAVKLTEEIVSPVSFRFYSQHRMSPKCGQWTVRSAKHNHSLINGEWQDDLRSADGDRCSPLFRSTLLKQLNCVSIGTPVPEGTSQHGLHCNEE